MGNFYDSPNPYQTPNRQRFAPMPIEHAPQPIVMLDPVCPICGFRVGGIDTHLAWHRRSWWRRIMLRSDRQPTPADLGRNECSGSWADPGRADSAGRP